MTDPYRPTGNNAAQSTRAEIEVRKGGIVFVFVLALAAGALGNVVGMVQAALGGLLGYGLAVGLELLWGERTRPKNQPLWWLLILAFLVILAFTSWADGPRSEERIGLTAGLLALGIGLSFRHDQGLTPSLFLAGAVWIAVLQGGRMNPDFGGASRMGEAEAVWIALTVLLGIIAATLEHERLLRRTGAGTPVPWTVIRFGFLSVWTLVILSLREDVQWGRLFVLLGANLQGQDGQMFLIGVIVIAIVIAAFAFRPGKEPPKET